MRSAPAATAICAILLGGGASRGDAVPPRPTNCPPGTVGVTSHGGPRCESEAPRDCPPGWLGVVGGTCSPHVCSEDSDCRGGGKRCQPQTLCFERHYCHPRSCGNDRTPYFSAAGMCGEGARCDSPSECRSGKVCLPVGVTAASVNGTPGGAARTSGGARGVGGGGAGGTRGSGGCAGCGQQSAAVGLSAIFGLCWIALLRRRR